MSRKSEPTPTIDTSLEPPQKKRTESDETLALRALRQFRQLAERQRTVDAMFNARTKEIADERAALTDSLSPSVAALVDAMRKVQNGAGQ